MSIADDPEDCLECGRPGLPVAVLISSTAALCPDCARGFTVRRRDGRTHHR